MIVAENVHKSFGNLEVLKGVNFEIEQGKIVAITGASGAGKTTLLQILGTLSRPNCGTVKINDRNVSDLRGKKLAIFRNKHIGFVFQFHHLLPEFNALENVCIPAFINKRTKKEAQTRACYLLTELGLTDRLYHKPAELSGGEKQRVAIARALINDPQFIFADEPSGNLDSKNKEELHQLFFRLRDEMAQSFVIVTHDNDFAAKTDQIIHLTDGEVK